MKALSIFFGILSLLGIFFAKEFGAIWPIIFITLPGIYSACQLWHAGIQMKRDEEVRYHPEFRKTWER